MSGIGVPLPGGNGTVDDYFLPAPLELYTPLKAQRDFGGVPRFGHTDQFARLLSTDPKEQEDYIIGLLFVGCFLLCWFLVWTLVIAVFKCFVNGFLAGEPFVSPGATLNKLADPEEIKAWESHPRRVRFVFFLSGILVIIFSILLVTEGVTNLQQTTDVVQSSTGDMRALMDESMEVAGNLEEVGQIGLSLRNEIIGELNPKTICPDNPVFNQTDFGKALTIAAAQATVMMNNLGDFVEGQAKQLKEAIVNAKLSLDEADATMNTIEQNEWIGGLVAFPYLVLTSLLLVGAVAAQGHVMTDCYLCFLDWVVLPLFVLVTIVAYVVLAAISFAAALNADFCGGTDATPDQTVVNTLAAAGNDQNGMVFKTVRYFAYQCTAAAQEDPFIFLRQFDGSLVESREQIQSLATTMSDISVEQLSLGCNRDFRPLHRALAQMVGIMDILEQTSDRALNVVDCARIVPVYTDIVYEGTCKYSLTGFTWIFSCLIIVSFFGMLMITFRSSFRNTVFEVKNGDDGENFEDEPLTGRRR